MADPYAAEDGGISVPPYIHAMRALDHLWMAANALSFLPGRAAKYCREEVESVQRRFVMDVLPKLLRETHPEDKSND